MSKYSDALSDLRSGKLNVSGNSSISYNGVSGNPADFGKLYQQIADKKAQQQEDKQNKKIQASGLDKFMHDVNQAGEDIANILGIQEKTSEAWDEGNIPGVAGGVVAGLVPGIISAPFTGMAKAYGALTGRDFQSIDDEGMMNANKLSGAQRAWEGIDSAIDIGGLGMFGSGRALGAGARSALEAAETAGRIGEKSALRKAADFIMPEGGRGVFAGAADRAFKDSGDEARRIAGFGAQLAADTLGEGAEEFIQTYAEAGTAGRDFDSDLFGEAFKAGTMGAIGGGVMGAAGGGVHLAKDLRQGPQGSVTTEEQEKQFHDPGVYDNDYKSDLSFEERGIFAGAAKAKAAEEQGIGTKREGWRMTVAGNMGDDSMGIDGYTMGSDILVNSWALFDQERRDAIANDLGMSTEELNQIMTKGTITEQDYAKLNQNLGKRNPYLRRTIIRDPDTTTTSSFDAYLWKIVPGDSIGVHPMAAILSGGDVDGDTRGTYRNTDGKSPLASQMWNNPDGGTDYDFEFFRKLDSDVARDKLRDEFIKLRNSIVDPRMNFLDDETINELVNYGSLAGGKSDENKTNAVSLRNVLMLISENAKSYRGSDEDASEAIDQIIRIFDNVAKSSAVIDSFVSTEHGKIVDMTEDLSETVHEEENQDKQRRSEGSVGNAQTSAAYVYQITDTISVLVSKAGNVSFRFDSTDKYDIAKHYESLRNISGLIAHMPNETAVDKLTAKIFQIIGEGEDINENITGVFNFYVTQEFVRYMDQVSNAKLGSKACPVTIEQMKEEFVRIHNEYVKLFNDAIKKTFNDGWVHSFGSIEKSEIGTEKFGIVFGKMFENVPVSEWFNFPDNSIVTTSGMTFGDMMKVLANNRFEISDVEYYMSDDVREFFVEQADVKRNEQFRVENSYRQMQEAVPITSAEQVGYENREQLLVYGNAMLSVLPNNAYTRLGIFDPVDLRNSKYGKALYEGGALASGNTKIAANMRMSVAVAMALDSKYMNFRRSLQKYKETNDNKYYDICIQELRAARNGSALTECIYYEFVEKDGKTTLLDALTNLQTKHSGYDERSRMYNELIKSGGYQRESLLVAALQENPGSVGYSELSTRIMDNMRYVNEIEQTDMQKCVYDVKKLDDYIQTLDGESRRAVIPMIRDCAVEEMFEENKEMVAAVLIDSVNNQRKSNEKGTEIASAAMAYQQVKVTEMGYNISLSSESIDRSVGRMSVSDLSYDKMTWIDIIFNGKTVVVYDNDGNAEVEVNIEFLLGEKPKDNGNISLDQFMKLLRDYPQLIRLFSSHKITPSLRLDEAGSVQQVAEQTSGTSLLTKLQNYQKEPIQDRDERIEKARMHHELMRTSPNYLQWLALIADIDDETGVLSHDAAIKADLEMTNFMYELMCLNNSEANQEVKAQIIEDAIEEFTKDLRISSYKSRTFGSELARFAINPSGFIFSDEFLTKEVITNVLKNYKDIEPLEMFAKRRTGKDDIDENEFADALFRYAYNIIDSSMKESFDAVNELNSAAIAILGEDHVARIITTGIKKVFENETAQQFSFSVDEIVERVIEKVKENFPTKYISIDNALEADSDKLEEMYRNILEDSRYCAFADEAWENDKDRIRELIENRSSGKDDREKFLDYHKRTLNRVTSGSIDEIRSFVPIETVNSLFFDVQDVVEGLDFMMDDLKESGIPFTQGTRNPNGHITPPVLNVSNPRNVYASIHSSRLSMCGKIATDVALNGAEQVDSHGIAVEPHDAVCNGQDPEPVKFGEIKDRLCELGNTRGKIIDPSGKETEGVLSSFDFRNFSNDCDVIVYEKSKCTCPWCCSKHFGGSYSYAYDGYLQAKYAYQVLLRIAQENMNLKLKKKIDMCMRIVPNANKNSDGILHKPLDINTNDQDQIVALVQKDIFGKNGFAKKMGDKIYQVLESYNVHNDVGRDNIDALAQACSSYIKVTGANGNSRIISLYDLARNEKDDGAEFAELLESLGGKITQITPSPKSISQLNKRVESKIANALEGDTSLSRDDAQKMAFDSIVDFRDYNSNPIAAERLLRSVSVFRNSGPTHIVPGAHLSAEQRFNMSLDTTRASRRSMFSHPKSVDRYVSDDFKNNQCEIFGKAKGSYDDPNMRFVITKFNMDYGNYDSNHREELNLKAGPEGHVWDKLTGGFEVEHVSGKDSAAMIMTNDLDKIKGIILGRDSDYHHYQVLLVEANSSMNEIGFKWGVDTQIIGGRTFYKIDLRTFEFNDDNDSFTFAEMPIDIGEITFVFFDDNLSTTDGDGYASKEFVDKHVVSNDDPIEIDVSTRLDTKGSPRVARRDELRDIARDILDGKITVHYDKNNTDEENAYVNKFVPWLENIRDNGPDSNEICSDGFVTSTRKHYQPFAIIIDGDGTNCVIAYASGSDQNTGIEVSWYEKSSNGKVIKFHQHSETRYGDDGMTLKGTPSGEPSKGIIRSMLSKFMQKYPNVIPEDVAKMVINKNTRAGRVLGLEESIAKESCVWLSKRIPSNALVEVVNGTLNISDSLNISIDGNDRSLTPFEIDQLRQRTYNDPVWRQIASGDKELFKNDPGANKVLARLARECVNKNNGIVMSELMFPWEIKQDVGNGKWEILSFEELYSPENDMSSMLANSKLVSKNIAPKEIGGVFKTYRYRMMCELYSKINKSICPDPAKEWTSGSTVLDDKGYVLMKVNDETSFDYYPGRITLFNQMVHDPGKGEVSRDVKEGNQRITSSALAHGMRGDQWEHIKNKIMLKRNMIKEYNANKDDDLELKSDSILSASQTISYTTDENFLSNVPLEEFVQRRYIETVESQARTFSSKSWIKIVRGSGDNKEVISYNSPEFNNIRERVAEKLGIKDKDIVSPRIVMNLFCVYDSRNYGKNSEVTIPQLNQFVDAIFADGIHIFKGGATHGDNRIECGLLPNGLARFIYDNSTKVSVDLYPSGIDEFYKSMIEAYKNTTTSVNLLPGKTSSEKAKMSSIKFLHTYIESTWGDGYNLGDLYKRMDMVEASRKAIEFIEAGFFPDEKIDDYKHIIDASAEQIEMAARQAEKMRMKQKVVVDSSTGYGNEVSYQKNDNVNWFGKVMRNLNDLLMVNAVLDPGVSIGSVVEGTLRGKVLDIATSLSFGPWSKNLRTIQNQESIDKAASDRDAQILFRAMRECEVRGDLDAFLLGLDSQSDVDEIIENLYGGSSQFDKIKTRIFNIASADTMQMKGQLRRFFKFLDAYITDKNVREWLIKDPSGNTRLETAIVNDPAGFIRDILRTSSPVRPLFLRAVNTSNTFSLAQSNVTSLVMDKMLENRPLAKLVVGTTLSPFIRYNTNLLGRGLNFFMPISTVNWYVVNHLSKFDTFKDMGIERVQVYTDIKKAMIADAAKMGFAALAAVLATIAGAIQPPDDDDLKGNYKEWLIFGHRIGADYVFTDLLGPTMPYACFVWGLLNEGTPRFDLLFDGIGDIAGRNPALKLGEVLDIIASPSDVEKDLEDEADNYTYAPSGEPTIDDLGSAKFGAAGLAVAGRIITPAFIRSLGRGYSKQKSYNRVWAADAQQTESDTGYVDDTVRIDYDDAVIRKVTRDNPVLGEIMNFITSADTSYSGSTSIFAKNEMPPTVYQDPLQREISQIYSIKTYNEKTKEYDFLPDNERQKVALNIIATLQSYSDIEDLYSSGFMIDTDTRLYVGDMIWQIVTEIQQDYYDWAYSSDGDNYVLGNGNWQAGAQIKEEAYKQMQQQVSYWKDFYYKKLNSEQMKRGVQRYMRENVEYWQDDNGEWYASGYHRGMRLLSTDYLGFKTAPGTISDPQGTMGYSGNWDTPAAYNDMISTGERSLIPIKNNYGDTIPFDDLADQHEELAAALDKSKNGSSKKSSSRSGYGGGSGGSGGGGGGGGGYSPSIYSRPGSVNVPSARTISTGNPSSGRYDYLRPNFETKGSREASKRGDF